MTDPPATNDLFPLNYYDARDVHYLNIQGIILLLRERPSEANERACNALLVSFRQLDYSAQQPQR